MRAVDEKAGGELVAAGLKEGFRDHRGGVQDGEDGAERGQGFDVRGTVQRVERDRELGVHVENLRLVRFFRGEDGDRADGHRIAQDVVGEDVERLLAVTVAGIADHFGQRAGEGAAGEDFGDAAPGLRDRKHGAAGRRQPGRMGGDAVEIQVESQMFGHFLFPGQIGRAHV